MVVVLRGVPFLMLSELVLLLFAEVVLEEVLLLVVGTMVWKNPAATLNTREPKKVVGIE